MADNERASMPSQSELEEKSHVMAAQIALIGQVVVMMDLDHLKQVIEDLAQRANRRDSMAPLISNYNPQQSELDRKMAQALQALYSYITSLKEIDQLKSRISEVNKIRSDINSMF